MHRGLVMVCCVLLVFVGISMGANLPNTTESHVKHQDGSSYERNEVNANWNETDAAQSDITINMSQSKSEMSTNNLTASTSEDTNTSKPLAPGYVPGKDFAGEDILGFYKLYKLENEKSWYEAAQTCVNEDAHLLLINTLPESRAMVIPMAEAGTFGKWHWVGVHDGQESAVISNETAEEKDIYKCQVVRYDIFTINYDRQDCTQKKPFICEMNTVT